MPQLIYKCICFKCCMAICIACVWQSFLECNWYCHEECTATPCLLQFNKCLFFYYGQIVLLNACQCCIFQWCYFNCMAWISYFPFIGKITIPPIIANGFDTVGSPVGIASPFSTCHLSYSLTLIQLKHFCLDPVSHVDNGCPLTLTFRILWNCLLQHFLVFLQYSCFSCDSSYMPCTCIWSDYDDDMTCFVSTFTYNKWGCCSCLAWFMYHLFIFCILYMHIENILNLTGTDTRKEHNYI